MGSRSFLRVARAGHRRDPERGIGPGADGRRRGAGAGPGGGPGAPVRPGRRRGGVSGPGAGCGRGSRSRPGRGPARVPCPRAGSRKHVGRDGLVAARARPPLGGRRRRRAGWLSGSDSAAATGPVAACWEACWVPSPGRSCTRSSARWHCRAARSSSPSPRHGASACWHSFWPSSRPRPGLPRSSLDPADRRP